MNEPTQSETGAPAPSRRVDRQAWHLLSAQDIEVLAARRRRRLVVALAALGVVAALGTGWLVYDLPSAPSSAGQYYAAGIAEQEAGRFAAAVVQLKNALVLLPDFPEARRALGESLVEVGDGAGALKELDEAERLGFEPELPDLARVRAMIIVGQHDEAVQHLQATPPPPGDGEAAVLLGQAYGGLGRIEEAAAAFEAALRADPTHVDARLGLARVFRRQGRLDRALDQIHTVLEAAPERPLAWYLQGEVQLQLGRYEKAAASFERVIGLIGPDRRAVLGRSSALLGTGQADAALEAVGKRLAVAPDDWEANLVAAAAHLARDEPEATRRAVQVTLSQRPDHPGALLLGGLADFRADSFESAASRLARYLNAVPGHVLARKVLAAAHLRRGDPHAAIEVLAPLAAAGRRDREILTLLGLAYARRDDPERAVTFLELGGPQADTPALPPSLEELAFAAETSAETLPTGFTLGITAAPLARAFQALAAGEHERALAVAQQYLRAHPAAPVALYAAARAREAQGEHEAASALLTAAIEANDRFASPHFALARLALARGEREASRAYFEAGAAALPEIEEGGKDVFGYLAGGHSDRSLNRLRLAHALFPEADALRGALADHLLRVGATQEALGLVAGASDGGLAELEGRAHFANGDYAAAAAAYERLARARPDSVAARLALGAAHQRAGAAGPARAAFEEAAALAPDDPRPRAALGRLALAAGAVREAETIGAALVDAAPASPAGYALLGDAESARGHHAAAAARYAAGAERGSEEAALKQVRALRRAGDEAGSERVLRDWVAQRPADVRARGALASALHARGAKQEALHQYLAAARRAPGDPYLLNNLAWLMSELGDPRAVPAARRAVALAPGDANLLDTLGWVLARAGDTRDAVAVLEEAVRINGDVPAFRRHLEAARAVLAGEHATADEAYARLRAPPDPG